MNQLEVLIREEITANAFISFRQFMELALYHPQLGYYTSDKPKIGSKGDFYTSSDVGIIFGAMLAKKIAELWRELNCPREFYLVEYGAGKGILARDILLTIKKEEPELFSLLTYGIVELSPSMQRLQREILESIDLPGQIVWLDKLKDAPRYPLIGCVLSNELLDAFPVHLVQLTNQGLMEAVVKSDQDEELFLDFSLPASEEIQAFLELADTTLEVGQTIEVNLDSIHWLEEVSGGLEQGYILTIDYGYLSQELAAPHRFDGTLLCYQQHQVQENPLEEIGLRDITAHVNFSALINWGEKHSLQKVEYGTQGRFLINMGIGEQMQGQSEGQFDLEKYRLNQKIRQLIMPGGMGDAFKILLQRKK